MSKEKSPEY
jgi:hypothetical protein